MFWTTYKSILRSGKTIPLALEYEGVGFIKSHAVVVSLAQYVKLQNIYTKLDEHTIKASKHTQINFRAFIYLKNIIRFVKSMVMEGFCIKIDGNLFSND